MELVDRLVHRTESSQLLDQIADKLKVVVSPLVAKPAVKDLLTGRWLGHSVHPMLVALPIGCWVSAALMDLTGSPEAARRLTAAGVIVAAPTAMTGLGEWIDTDGAERRVGTAHALLNDVAVVAFAASWVSRRSERRRGTDVLLSGVGLGAMTAAGYLGGHLAYVRGVAVNTTAFQSGPDEFQRLVRLEDVDPQGMSQAQIGGLSFLVVRRGSDVYVMEDRCSHRGAPLSDGELVGDCIECPWHGSHFRLSDGAVRKGPASVPQPVYESRVTDGWIEVRRQELGGLRRDPVDASHEQSPADAS